MKRFLFAAVVGSLILSAGSCDKVEHPYPETGAGTLDWSLYPNGDSAHYAQNEWPVFTENTNTLRNVLVEDFTGHWCTNCPPTAAAVHNSVEANPDRVFAAGMHSGSLGMTSFQELHPPLYTEIFYNDEVLEIGSFLGGIPGSTFTGNPRIAINRIQQNGQHTCSAGSLATLISQSTTSQLKVNIQAAANYFPSTRGLFLHTEIDQIDQNLPNDLGLVVYIIEDSLVAPQKMPDATDDLTYVHKDIMRGCIDGNAFGRVLTAADLSGNNKYYVNYSYKLPDQYNADNMHLLIYVYDKVTYEIYQVIKQEMD
jgi:hypothetical protein